MQDAAEERVQVLLINAAAAQAPRRSEAEGTQKCQSMCRWWLISGQGQPGSGRESKFGAGVQPAST